ncbi:MAG: STAS domain-containing protein [Candidatus Acidiferrum sp.]
METAIGVFDSRENAETAVKELLHKRVPEDSIVFLTRSQNDALSFSKDLGTFAGGFIGGAVGTTAGCVGAALAMIPGFGQIFALGVGGAALLGLLGAKVGGKLTKNLSNQQDTPEATPPESSGEEGAQLLDVLKHGRSVVVVRTESQQVAAIANAVLDKLGLGKQAQQPSTTSSSETTTRTVEGVIVIDARGKIAFGEGVTRLRETVAHLITSGDKKVILNLKEVDYVDSSGMGEIVRSHMAIRKQGGQFKLANLSKMVNELLSATSMNKVFDIQPDEATAVRSFTGSGASASAS